MRRGRDELRRADCGGSPFGNWLASAIGVQLIRRMSYDERTTAALPSGIALR
ncbi:hypothetical protein [Paenibacillus sp. NPDC057934]|uniref:hypothetical protein n=1 Tax=Paenibacillus sp. NPDC057934 TaxID=3346282 RepID=UPI0036DF00DF